MYVKTFKPDDDGEEIEEQSTLTFKISIDGVELDKFVNSSCHLRWAHSSTEALQEYLSAPTDAREEVIAASSEDGGRDLHSSSHYWLHGIEDRRSFVIECQQQGLHLSKPADKDSAIIETLIAMLNDKKLKAQGKIMQFIEVRASGKYKLISKDKDAVRKLRLGLWKSIQKPLDN